VFLPPSPLATSFFSFFFFFFFHICDVEILAKIAPKIAKLVKITLEKHINPKLKKAKIQFKEKQCFQPQPPQTRKKTILYT
jgi:hypothetical protein